jgi:chromosome segregation ATPase
MKMRHLKPPSDPVEALHSRLLAHNESINAQAQVIKDLEAKLFGDSNYGEEGHTEGIMGEVAKTEERIKAQEAELLRIEAYLVSARKSLVEAEARKDEAQKELDAAREKLTALYAEHKAILAKALAEAVRT